MHTKHTLRAKLMDGFMRAIETIVGRRFLNKIGAYFYWRTRGENLDDPDRNGEYRTIDVVMPLLGKNNPVVFDIGANIGDWSARLLERNDGCKIHAFEPASATFAVLTQRFRGQMRIQLNQAAVSDKAGSCVLRVEGVLSGSNSIYQMPNETSASMENVPAIVGDNFSISKNIDVIDFVKMDIEGHEVRALQGFSKLIASERIRFIQFEYNKTWIPAGVSLYDLYALLIPAGYRLCKIRANDVLCYRRYSRSLDNFCYSNWLAIRAIDYQQLVARLCIKEDTENDW